MEDLPLTAYMPFFSFSTLGFLMVQVFLAFTSYAFHVAMIGLGRLEYKTKLLFCPFWYVLPELQSLVVYQLSVNYSHLQSR